MQGGGGVQYGRGVGVGGNTPQTQRYVYVSPEIHVKLVVLIFIS